MAIFGYQGALLILQGMADPNGSLIGMPVNFVLKNKLHLAPHETALFGLVGLIPVYAGILFGLARDLFNPFGIRDRGFLALFGGFGALVYLVGAFISPSAPTLEAIVLTVGIGFMFIVAAQNGLMSTLAGQHAMSGQTSANQNLFISFFTVITVLMGGALSDRLERLDAAMAVRVIYTLGAGIMGVIALYGLWRPRAVFDHIHSEHPDRAGLLDELRRLVRHKAIWPALLIWTLWSFNPGDMTPLMYHLQNHLHATDGQWSFYGAIQFTAFLPTFVIYAWLCRRVKLRTLMWVSACIALPQYVGLAFIRSMQDAYVAGALAGALGGLATAAYLDLIIRSCPPGLQGAMLMLSNAVLNIAQRLGDMLGSKLYEAFGGFTVCVVAITVVYALIIPCLLLVPRHLTDHADGQLEAA